MARVVLLILAVGATLTSAQQPQTGLLVGRVTNSIGELPGATVVLTAGTVRRSTSTDYRGDYLIDGLTPGTYRLEVSFANQRAVVNVKVDADRLTRRDVWLQAQRPSTASHGAISVLSSAPQPQPGSIVGRVTDSSGGVLPGVTVTLTGPTIGTGVSDKWGGYRFETLTPGLYRIELNLPGFRTAVTESLSVEAGRSTRHDVTLRLGNFSIVDYIAFSPQEALKMASVAVHLRITRSLGPRFSNQHREGVNTDHEATILGVVKADSAEIAARKPLQFTQSGAGFLSDAGEAVVGHEQPFVPGASYILFLYRQPDGRLVALGGPFALRVSASGAVTIPRLPEGRPDMPVDEALAALRKLLVPRNPNRVDQLISAPVPQLN